MVTRLESAGTGVSSPHAIKINTVGRRIESLIANEVRKFIILKSQIAPCISDGDTDGEIDVFVNRVSSYSEFDTNFDNDVDLIIAEIALMQFD